MFAGNFAPRGWAFCDGQLLAVSQNDALFSLLGTTYGGDGRTTFGLPDMRGRVPLHAGQGPGLSNRRLGAKGGTEKVTLTVNQLPSHSHPLAATTAAGTDNNATGKMLSESPTVEWYFETAATANMATSSITNVGGSRSHTNLSPFLCVNYIIAMFGIYPSRH